MKENYLEYLLIPVFIQKLGIILVSLRNKYFSKFGIDEKEAGQFD